MTSTARTAAIDHVGHGPRPESSASTTGTRRPAPLQGGVTVLASGRQPAGVCLVCAHDVAAGEGVTVSYRGRMLRFKCPECFARFRADPEPFLLGDTKGCCGGAHDHSPASEWTE